MKLNGPVPPVNVKLIVPLFKPQPVFVTELLRVGQGLGAISLSVTEAMMPVIEIPL